MSTLEETAPAFVGVAHRIVWCTVATVDTRGRPRSRVLHPFWEWDGNVITGWIGTGPTPVKRAHLEHCPFVSCTYWDAAHDTAVAECAAEWHFDLDTRRAVWDRFKSTPEPLGYDPAIIPGWDDPFSEAFAVLRLTPWRLRVVTDITVGAPVVRDWSAG